MTESENDQVLQRKKKAQELREAGINPYGARFPKRDGAADLQGRYGEWDRARLEREPVTVVLAGRIVGLRRFGKAAFVHLLDGSGKIQAYFKKDRLGDDAFALFEKLDMGDFVGVEGHLFRTKTDELTIEVEKFTLLAKALRPLPEKWHGLTDIEKRYRQRYLDLIANPDEREVFIKRRKIIDAIRAFLVDRGYLEVETPMMQALPGGAAARPFVTHHNALDTDLYLRIAPELYLKRLIVGGFERVFEINRNFRNEGISTIHNPEFTMLEFYTAYADVEDLIALTEELLTAVALQAVGSLKFNYQGAPLDWTRPWRRLTFREAIAAATGAALSDLDDRSKIIALAESLRIPVPKNAARGVVLNEIFETAAEAGLVQPTFITEYPTDISPLARRSEANPEYTDRFELFVAGTEIANAFSELNDPVDQRRRFEAQAALRAAGDLEAHSVDEDYLRALEHGMPPTAGEGIGIDRLVMLLTDRASIRDVILFPMLRPESSP